TSGQMCAISPPGAHYKRTMIDGGQDAPVSGIELRVVGDDAFGELHQRIDAERVELAVVETVVAIDQGGAHADPPGANDVREGLVANVDRVARLHAERLERGEIGPLVRLLPANQR